MPLALVHSRALAGLDAPPVTVEVHLGNGLPSFNIVGLAETEVKESRDRVRAALANCRFDFPARRITVNLAPAELPKEGGRFDLPIALGILAASGQLPPEKLSGHEFAGELSLSGELRPVRGALAMALQAAKSDRTLVLPSASAEEGSLSAEAEMIAAGSLLEVCAHLSAETVLQPYAANPVRVSPAYPEFADVKGQSMAKRALEVAAAGRHSVLMVGPPGTGKSMLAARFPGLLPEMTDGEALESAALQSLSSLGFRPECWRQRPFRAPHHTSSAAALVGGGADPRPGDISLAHHGVLFLDEMPEFDRRVLEALREPLESGRVTVSRAARKAEFPARFQLIGAMNPCHCGYLGHYNGRCRCSPDQVARYRARLSGPLLDRIDLQIEVPALTPSELEAAADGERGARVRERVERAHTRALERQGKDNADLGSAEVDTHCHVDEEGRRLLKQAISRLALSARGYHRILKVARTVADLAGAAQVCAVHVAEAVQYRRLERAG